MHLHSVALRAYDTHDVCGCRGGTIYILVLLFWGPPQESSLLFSTVNWVGGLSINIFSFLFQTLIKKRRIGMKGKGFHTLKINYHEVKPCKYLLNAVYTHIQPDQIDEMLWGAGGTHLHRFVCKIEKCVLENKRTETRVINFRCGNVVRGNAVTVTRGKSKRERDVGKRGKGGFHSYTIHNFNLNYERREWRLIKHDKDRAFIVNPSTGF